MGLPAHLSLAIQETHNNRRSSDASLESEEKKFGAHEKENKIFERKARRTVQCLLHKGTLYKNAPFLYHYTPEGNGVAF